MLTITDLTLRIAGRVLLDSASVALPPRARIGFLGRNGTGKTTLFKAITGDLAVDSGRIDIPPRTRIGGVAQEAPGGPMSLIDFVLAADLERASLLHEADTAQDPARIAEIQLRLADIDAHSAPARAATILSGLGFDETAQARPCSDFSGGWRMRVALAAVLFTAPDLLLLDEPTNYLDLEGTLWLQDYLSRYPHSVLLISHDRDLLNAMAEHILHLSDCKLTLYKGNYDRFEQTRRAEIELRAKAVKKQDEKRAHLQSFVDRFRAKATKARQAQSRLKMLEKMAPLEAIVESDVRPFHFPPPDKPASPPIITLDGASVGYDDHAILKRLTLRIDDDDRIALLGANGNGKSTFLKLISGRLPKMAGGMVIANGLKIAYFAQHQLDDLRPEESVIQHVRRLQPEATEPKARAIAARFGFSGERSDSLVKSLSGGEKARLLLGLVTFEGPHLLILDEPTNHLDIDSRAALADALNTYPGAVMVVSHDRHLIEATVDRLWLVKDGTVAAYDGDLDDYHRLILSGPVREEKKPAAVPKSDAPKGDAKAQKKRIAEIEARMAKLQSDIDKIDRILAQPGYFEAHPKNAADAARVRSEREAALAQAEEEWLLAQDE